MLSRPIIIAILVTIFAYLVGSINFAVIFTKLFIKQDVRDMGSGNAGTTNVLRVGGFLPGALTFICDALKGFVAAGAGKLVFGFIAQNMNADWSNAVYGAFLCGFLCMIGHVFPIFFQFKGGKGVATSVGIFAVCCPIAIVLGLVAFAASTLITRIVSLSSLVATLVVVSLTIVFCDNTVLLWPQALLTCLMGAVVILKHSTNIKRLLSGTEKKIKIRR